MTDLDVDDIRARDDCHRDERKLSDRRQALRDEQRMLNGRVYRA